jgi:Tc5 transposase DNA-binding domain
LGRRLIGGLNEKQVVELFATVRLTQAEDGEPGDVDIVNGRVVLDEDEEDNDYVPSRRYAYSREHKLAAIDYFQTTWKQKQDDTYKRMSNRYTSRKLKITRKQLRDWVFNKEKIINQKKGSFRSCQDCTTTVQEPELERLLNGRFEKARDQGRKISYKWMLRHAKKIYEELQRDRIIVYKTGKRSSFVFRFSAGWYNSFRRRYCISLRCSTKRAQKSLEQLESVLQNWIQYNRRMLAIIKSKSIIGIPRGLDVPVVG